MARVDNKNYKFKKSFKNSINKIIDNKWQVLIVVLMVFSLTVFLYLNSFSTLVFNKQYYSNQYEINGVYDRFGVELVDNVTDNLFSYFQDESLAEWELINEDFFSERDKMHLIDVKLMINDVLWYHYLVLLAFIIGLLLLFLINKERILHNLTTVLIGSGVLIVIITLIALLLQKNFSQIFYNFHIMTFTNDLWMLNPAVDNLINIYPRSFFFNITKEIFMLSFVKGILLIITGLFIRYFKKILKFCKRTN
ncbi:DUF1461 domain-containing protein [Nanoarchaeota archaeon]